MPLNISKPGKAKMAPMPTPIVASNVLALPDNMYLRKALPAQLMAVSMSLVVKSQEYEINPSFLRNVNAEAVNAFHGLRESEVLRMALKLDYDANFVIGYMTGTNELCRCLAVCELVHYLASQSKVSTDSVSYAAADGILEEANSLGGEDWGGAKSVSNALASAKLAIAKLGYMYS